MSAQDLLEQLDSLGVICRPAAGDQLSLIPAERVPADMIPALRAAKAELLALVRARGYVPEGVQAGALWTWPDGSRHGLLESLWRDRHHTGLKVGS
jgi:hypothetical protein